MRDNLLATAKVAKTLTGSVFTTKTLRTQTEYMGTSKTQIILHGVPMNITEDYLGAFSDYGSVKVYSPVIMKLYCH